MADKLPRAIGTDDTDGNTGAATMEIAAGVLTASAGLEDEVGVGKVITWTTTGPVLHMSVIVSRTSATQFNVEDVAGGASDTATAGQSFAIYIPYQSLAFANSQAENANIPEPSENDINPSKGMVAADTQVDFPCYAGGAVTTDAGTGGWTADATHFLAFFTPIQLTEVGVTQRHNGTLQAASVAFRIETTNESDSAIQPHTDFSQYVGLQIVINEDTNERSAIATTFGPGDGITYSHNILKGVYTGTGSGNGIFINQAPDALIFNNIIYDFSLEGVKSHGSGSDFTVAYNNTVINCDVGFIVSGSGKMLLKNNITQDCASGCYIANFSAVFEIGSTNNLADDSTADDAAENMVNGVDDITLTFTNKAGDDFSLAAVDTDAIDGGADLSADALIAISDDVIGTSRPQGSAFDIGAFELISGASGSATSRRRLKSLVHGALTGAA